MKSYLAIFFLFISAVIASFYGGAMYATKQVIHDSITIDRPVPFEVVRPDTVLTNSLLKKIRALQRMNKTLISDLEVISDSLEITNSALAATKLERWRDDVTSLNLPRIQKKYESEYYSLGISGVIGPEVDYLNIRPKIVYVPHRWGVGITAAYGINSTFEPNWFIGIGVTYNIFTW